MLERFYFVLIVSLLCFFGDAYASVAPKRGLDISAKDLFVNPSQYFQSRNKINQPFIHRNFEIDIVRNGLRFKASFEPGNQDDIGGEHLQPSIGTLKGMVDNFLKTHISDKLGLVNNAKKRVAKKKTANSGLIKHRDIKEASDMGVGLFPYIKDPKNIAKSALDIALEEGLKESNDEIILNKLKNINKKITFGYKFGKKPGDRKLPFSEKVGFSLGEKPWGRVIFSVEKEVNSSDSPIKLSDLVDIEELSQEITLELGAKLLTYYAHFNNYFLNIKRGLVPYVEFPGMYLSSVVGPSFEPLFLVDNLKTWSEESGLSIGMLVQPGIQESIQMINENSDTIEQSVINNINFKSMDSLLLYFIEALSLNYDGLMSGALSFIDADNKFVDKSVARAFNDKQFKAFYDEKKVAGFSLDPESAGTTEVYISDGENSASSLEMNSDIEFNSSIKSGEIGEYGFIDDIPGDEGYVCSTSTSTSMSVEIQKDPEILSTMQKIINLHSKNKEVKFNAMVDILKNRHFPPFMMSFNYGYRPEFRDANNENYQEFKGRFSYKNKHEIPWGRVVFIVSSLGDSEDQEIVDVDINNDKYIALIISRVLKSFEKMIDENKTNIDNNQPNYYI